MKAIALITIAALTACAPSPDSIAPVGMAGAYSGLSCASAASALSVERANLQALSSAQREAAVGDAIGVFIIGIPIGSLTGGNKAGDIAASKGKVLALEARLAACG